MTSPKIDYEGFIPAKLFALRYAGLKAAEWYLQSTFLPRAKEHAARGQIWFPVFAYPIDEINADAEAHLQLLATILEDKGWLVDVQETVDRNGDDVCKNGWDRASIFHGVRPWRLLQASPMAAV